MNKEDIILEINSIVARIEQLELITSEDLGSCMVSVASEAIAEQMKLDQRLYQLEQMLKKMND